MEKTNNKGFRKQQIIDAYPNKLNLKNKKQVPGDKISSKCFVGGIFLAECFKKIEGELHGYMLMANQ